MMRNWESAACIPKNLDATCMTGEWNPHGQWNRIHGDGKSTTNGVFHLETMSTSTASYKVRLVERGSILLTTEYDEEPDFETIVADLKGKL